LNALKPDDLGPAIFVSERGAAFTPAGFAKLVERAGIKAGFKFKVHPHQLRHACASHLAPKIGQLEGAGAGVRYKQTPGANFSAEILISQKRGF